MPDVDWQSRLDQEGPAVPVVPVDELRQKYALLLKYMPDTDWNSLAARFGKPVGTVKFWGHGSARRNPDRMPEWAVPVLIDLFTALLPPSHAKNDVHRFVLGPATRLEEEIRAAASASLSAIIAREGRTGTALLIPKPDGASLVEIEAAPIAARRLPLGKWFRIEFPVDRAGAYAVALQHAQQVWAVLPASLVETGRRLLVPEKPGDDRDGYMVERRDVGLNQFVCLQSAQPFPTVIDEHAREGSVLDKRGIEALAARYESVPVALRSCHVLTVVFEPHDDPVRPAPAI